MAYDKVIDSARHDGALTATADAIRAKTGDAGKIAFDPDKGYAEAIEAIAGGGGLNFEVVGGTTQPTNPTKNLVWVNTSTTITGWQFSTTQPSTAETGMVWIQTSTSETAAFNALTENNITVYPAAVYQYSGSAWVKMPAKVYHDGTWTVFSVTTFYFKNGSGAQNTEFKSMNGSSASVTQTSSTVTGTSPTDQTGAEWWWLSAADVDLTDKNKLVFEATCSYAMTVASNDTYDARFLIVSKQFTTLGTPAMNGATEYACVKPTVTSSKKNFTINLNGSYTGKYSIGFWGCGSVVIYNVYAE